MMNSGTIKFDLGKFDDDLLMESVFSMAIENPFGEHDIDSIFDLYTGIPYTNPRLGNPETTQLSNIYSILDTKKKGSTVEVACSTVSHFKSYYPDDNRAIHLVFPTYVFDDQQLIQVRFYGIVSVIENILKIKKIMGKTHPRSILPDPMFSVSVQHNGKSPFQMETDLKTLEEISSRHEGLIAAFGEDGKWRFSGSIEIDKSHVLYESPYKENDDWASYSLYLGMGINMKRKDVDVGEMFGPCYNPDLLETPDRLSIFPFIMEKPLFLDSGTEILYNMLATE